MNNEEKKRYLLLVPSERLKKKKKYCQQTCKLKKDMRRLKITFKEISAFLNEVTRQRHVNNSADARSHGHDQRSLSSHLVNSA